MSGTAVGIGAMIGTLVTAVAAALVTWRTERREGDKGKLELAEMVRKMATEEVERMMKRVDRLEDQLHDMQTVMASDVAPLVAYIDSGADPPPPEVSAALRRVLAEARQ